MNNEPTSHPTPPANAGGPLQLPPSIEGCTIPGPAGAIRFARHPGALALHRHEPSPTHWILPLDQPEMVRLSADLPGDILWLSPHPPRSLLGTLIGDFRGAWWEGSLIVLALHGTEEALAVPAQFPGFGSNQLLAEVLVRRWLGHALSSIQISLLIHGGLPGSLAPGLPSSWSSKAHPTAGAQPVAA